ncbi:phosphate ABC transporter ATP-binding protein [Ammoniphilus sp. YIM 78166]|uniref:phosphate ABC transporter ATP-binding protein n=1 Tax=Ammoniphilus sp. YIM 78166 TaxID=1644106 RepID=UPI00106FC3DC|nr:ATP-binding cassette domain-containing protein [Ammoniphilus sp. YIM 78166]
MVANVAEYDQVCVEFEGRETLSIPHLELQAARRYAVVGPSGSGKSTFLRLTNLLEKPAKGQMRLFQKNLPVKGYSRSEQLELQRQMVYVSQKPVMFDISVFDNVAMGLRYRNLSKVEINERVEAVLQAVRLTGFTDRRAVSLSGGEAQRIALARALVIEPKLLLLDEPTSNLDPMNIEIIEEAIHQIYKQIGVTIVMVTHNLQQARRVGDEIIFVHQGKVYQKQERDQFFDSPREKEIEDFITGRMIY